MAQEHKKGQAASEEGTAASRQPDETLDEHDPMDGDPGEIRRHKGKGGSGASRQFWDKIRILYR